MAIVGDEIENKGRYAGIPESWNPWIGLFTLILGLAGVSIFASRAVRLRRNQSGVIGFERSHITIAAPLLRATRVIDRRAIVGVQVLPVTRSGRVLGLQPVITIRTSDGRRPCAIPPFYEGDPDALAADIARWAAAPLTSPTKRA
jgi:hypothetical protein